MSKARINKAKIVTDGNLPVPRNIPQMEMKALLEAHNLDGTQGKQMAIFLQKMVDEYAKHVRDMRIRKKTRSHDQKQLKSAVKKLSQSKRLLKSCGPVGRSIIRSEISKLGGMFSLGWLRDTFPDGDVPEPEIRITDGPRRSAAGPDDLSRKRRRRELADVEQHTLQARRYFVEARNLEVAASALDEIQRSIEVGLTSSQNPGRKDAVIRHYLILQLADGWKSIGRDPFKSGGFQFQEFCEHVFEGIRWPTSGLKPAVRKAIADLIPRP
jgi:hypothetical protein